MDESQPELIWTLAPHIRAAARPDAETTRLLEHLATVAWPGGPADHTDPVARGWLRFAGPGRPVTTPACTCASGRCRICN